MLTQAPAGAREHASNGVAGDVAGETWILRLTSGRTLANGRGRVLERAPGDVGARKARHEPSWNRQQVVQGGLIFLAVAADQLLRRRA